MRKCNIKKFIVTCGVTVGIILSSVIPVMASADGFTKYCPTGDTTTRIFTLNKSTAIQKARVDIYDIYSPAGGDNYSKAWYGFYAKNPTSGVYQNLTGYIYKIYEDDYKSITYTSTYVTIGTNVALGAKGNNPDLDFYTDGYLNVY